VMVASTVALWVGHWAARSAGNLAARWADQKVAQKAAWSVDRLVDSLESPSVVSLAAE
jgi:hypothetical protein